MAVQNAISSEEIARVKEDLSEIGTILNSLRKLAAEITDDKAVVVETLAQKAGYLSDRCLTALGEPLVVGDFEAWSSPAVSQD